MNCHGVMFFTIQIYSICLSSTKRCEYDQQFCLMCSLQLSWIALIYFSFLIYTQQGQTPHRDAYLVSDWIPVVQTQLYISYSSPFMRCVLCLLLGKICRAGEFDPSQNKLRCTVLAVLSSRAIQQLREAMLCWLDLSTHLTAHTYTWTFIPMRCRENWKVCKSILCMCWCALGCKECIKFQ